MYNLKRLPVIHLLSSHTQFVMFLMECDFEKNVNPTHQEWKLKNPEVRDRNLLSCWHIHEPVSTLFVIFSLRGSPVNALMQNM